MPIATCRMNHVDLRDYHVSFGRTLPKSAVTALKIAAGSGVEGHVVSLSEGAHEHRNRCLCVDPRTRALQVCSSAFTPRQGATTLRFLTKPRLRDSWKVEK